MAHEPLVQRCYYLLKALHEATFARVVSGSGVNLGQLPEHEPEYMTVVQQLLTLRRSLDRRADGPLYRAIENLLNFGHSWEQVRGFVDNAGSNRDKMILEINNRMRTLLAALGKSLPDRRAPSSTFDISSLALAGKMKWFKVEVEGVHNPYNEGSRSVLKVKARAGPAPPVRSRSPGDAAVYLHNPVREEVIFVKERFLQERFPDSLQPFMKAFKLQLYKCSVETMVSHLVRAYAREGELALLAMSSNSYSRTLDDRTLFVVLQREGGDWRLKEMCYGGLRTRVALVQMQTFAYCAHMRPDDLVLVDIGEEFARFDLPQYSDSIPDTDRTALLGWWNTSVQRIVELYIHQNLRIVLADLAYTAIWYLKLKSVRLEGDILSLAFKEGFSLDWKPPKESRILPFNRGLRSSFYKYLQKQYGKGWTEHSSDEVIERLVDMLRFTQFSEDPEADMALKRKQLYEILSDHSAIKDIKKYWKRKARDITGAKRRELFAERDVEQKAVLQSLTAGRSEVLREKKPRFFEPAEFGAMRRQFSLFNKSIKSVEGLVRKELATVFDKEISIDIGRKRFYSVPAPKGANVEAQAEQLFETGFRTFIFYGTSGSVKGVPVESFVIPERIYFYPGNWTRIDPANYVPLPMENLLLTPSAGEFFKTDNFYKTEHIFVAATYQEHEGFLRKVIDRFSSSKEVSIDMDVAPLAKFCMENGAGLGILLYNTDELKGALQDESKKGYYLRQLILMFLRAFDSTSLSINGRRVEDLLNESFDKVLDAMIRGRR